MWEIAVILIYLSEKKSSYGCLSFLFTTGAACSVVVKLLDLDPQDQWLDPWCGHDKICTTVGPLSKAPNPTLGYVSCLV